MYVNGSTTPKPTRVLIGLSQTTLLDPGSVSVESGSILRSAELKPVLQTHGIGGCSFVHWGAFSDLVSESCNDLVTESRYDLISNQYMI